MNPVPYFSLRWGVLCLYDYNGSHELGFLLTKETYIRGG